MTNETQSDNPHQKYTDKFEHPMLTVEQMQGLISESKVFDDYMDWVIVGETNCGLVQVVNKPTSRSHGIMGLLKYATLICENQELESRLTGVRTKSVVSKQAATELGYKENNLVEE